MQTVRDFIKKSSTYFYCLFPLSIAFNQKISTIVIGLWLVVSLCNGRFKNFNYNKQMLLLPALYILYLISMLVFSPFDFGILERRASLLLFPILFGLTTFSKEDLRKMYKYYIYGCLFALTVCYFVAIYKSLLIEEGYLKFNPYVTLSSDILYGGNHFFGDHFSIFHQSVYASLYLNIAIIGVLNLEIFNKIQKWILLVLFGVAIFQISNKANIIFMVIVFCIYLLYKINRTSLKWVSIFSIIVLGIVVMTIHPRTRMMLSKFNTEGVKLDRESSEGYGVRLLVWDASLELLKSNYLLGVGVSNAYIELKKVYKEKRYVYPFRNRLNSHNQFFQLMIECGFLGAVLILIQLWNLLKGLKKELIIVFSIGVLFCLNFMLESVFNRYSGIMIYSFFYCYLICYKTNFQKIES